MKFAKRKRGEEGETRGDVFGISKQKLCAKGAKREARPKLLNATGNLVRWIVSRNVDESLIHPWSIDFFFLFF